MGIVSISETLTLSRNQLDVSVFKEEVSNLDVNWSMKGATASWYDPGTRSLFSHATNT